MVINNMKKYSFLIEGVGRNLVNVSSYASRNNVAQQLLQKYPDPKVLSQILYKLSIIEKINPKRSAYILSLSNQCKMITDKNEYIKFLNKISGFSAIWSKIASVALTGGAIYLAAKYIPGLSRNSNTPKELEPLQNTQTQPTELAPLDPV